MYNFRCILLLVFGYVEEQQVVAHRPRYGCHSKSSLVMRLKAVEETCTGLRRALTSRGFCSSRRLTAAIFCWERAVLGRPELFLLRFRLVPCSEYFLKFCRIVLLLGGFRPGNLCRNAFCTATKLWSALDHRQDTHITATAVYTGQRYSLTIILHITSCINFITE
jgi:hypothetical protein